MTDLRNMMKRADGAWDTGRHALAQFFYRSLANQPASSTVAVFSPNERIRVRERLQKYESAVRATEKAFDSFYYYQDMPAVEESIRTAETYVQGLPRLQVLANVADLWLSRFDEMRTARRAGDWQRLRVEAETVRLEFPSNREAMACLELAEEGERFVKRLDEFTNLATKNGQGIDAFDGACIECVFAAARALDDFQREARYPEDLAHLFQKAQKQSDALDKRAADALYNRVICLVKCRKINDAQQLLVGSAGGASPSKETKGARPLWLETRGTAPPPTGPFKDRLRGEHNLALAAFGDDEDPLPKDLGPTIVDALLVFAGDIEQRLLNALGSIREFNGLHRWNDALEVTVRLHNYFPAGEDDASESKFRIFINRAAEVERNLRTLISQKKDIAARKSLAKGEEVLTVERVQYWRREITKLASRRRARNLLIAATALGLIAAYLILTL